MSAIIGIDFGAAFTRVAYMDQSIETILDSLGNNNFPSVVACTKLGQWITGHLALLQAAQNPEQTFFSIKSLLDLDVDIEVMGKTMEPFEIISFFFEDIKKSAELHFGKPVTEVILSRPNYFSRKQVSKLKKAAELAYLTVKDIHYETDATALYYGQKYSYDDYIYAIVDVGASGTSVAICESGDGVIEIKAVSGTKKVSGNVINKRLSDHFIAKFEQMHGLKIKDDLRSYMDVFNAAELSKVILSKVPYHQVFVANLSITKEGVGLDLNFRFSANEMEELIADLKLELNALIEDVLRNSGLSISNIEVLVVAGGSMNLPFLANTTIDFFRKETKVVHMTNDVIARGNAIRGAILTGWVKDLLLLSCCALPLGLMLQDGSLCKLIDDNTTIPTKKVERFTISPSLAAKFIEIHVFEGFSKIAVENTFLGTLIVPYKDQAEIVVSFELHAIRCRFFISARFADEDNDVKLTLPVDYELPDPSRLKSLITLKNLA